MEAPRIGALVVPSPAFRSTMGTGEGAAILLSIRRGAGHLYYPGTGRGFWVPLRDVRELPDPAVRGDSLERFLSSLLLHLEAEDCSLEEAEAPLFRMAVEVPGVDREGIEELRGLLKERLKDYEIEPAGRHALLLRLDLVDLPAAQG